MQLYQKILIGLGLGVVVGLAANLLALEWMQTALVAIEPIGTLFIRLLTMIIIPLVVASLLIGTASLGDITKLGRMGGKTVAYYMATTAIAVTIGIVLSNVIEPGSSVDPETQARLASQFGSQAEALTLDTEAPGLREFLLGLVPENVVGAAAAGNLLPLIVFTIIFGAAISLVGEERRKSVITFFEGVNDATIVIIHWIMKLAPYAVFALIAAVVSRFGLDLLQSLLFYALTVVAGLALHAFGTYGIAVRWLAKLNPLQFFRRIIEAPVVAFSTSSSSATLPVTMETAEEELGISNETSSFVLPLGATVNMDGTALYQAVAVMFIAQIYGVSMGIPEQLTIVLTATLASIGAAGVPGAGIITLVLVLQSVGLGAEAAAGIALILGVDRPLDMLRTSVNITGDLSAASFVARSEGEELMPAKVPEAVPAPALAESEPAQAKVAAEPE